MWYDGLIAVEQKYMRKLQTLAAVKGHEADCGVRGSLAGVLLFVVGLYLARMGKEVLDGVKIPGLLQKLRHQLESVCRITECLAQMFLVPDDFADIMNGGVGVHFGKHCKVVPQTLHALGDIRLVL